MSDIGILAKGALLSSSGTINGQLTAGSNSTVLQADSTQTLGVKWSTATFPSTAGTAGKVLISDGTNIVSSTPTYPNAASTALKHIKSDGTNFVTTTVTYPDASVTAGKVIISDGTNYIASTPTFPNSASGTGTLLRADGTNWVATTSTYPNTNAVNTLLYASSANVMSALATANNSIVLTDGSGVPSLGTSLSNDFTFTKASSGATTTLTVSNTSNTANSAANILAQVAGGTAADATHQSTISGGQAWTWGLDNSDSDAYVIASSATLGTTNVMRTATSGEITFPLQSAFLATSTSTQANVTGDSTSYTMQFTTEIYDQNNDYDATSTFTAPVTGRYHFSGLVSMTGWSAGTINGELKLIASNRTFATNSKSINTNLEANNFMYLNFSTYMDMDAADTVTITVNLGGGTKVADVVTSTGYNYFGGKLVC